MGARRGAAALLVALALAACGHHTTPRRPSTQGTGFLAAYQAATADYTRASQETATQAQHLKGDQAATLKVYAELAVKVDAVRRQYTALPTPAKIAPQVSAVIRLLSEQVTLLRKIAPEVKANDTAAVRDALTALSRSTADLATARVQLDGAIKACGTDCT